MSNDVLKKLEENRNRLNIKRVPIHTKREFIQWCEEEFEGDYGMGLKWLWDFYNGVFNGENFIDKINNLENKIESMEGNETGIIRTVGGTQLRRK